LFRLYDGSGAQVASVYRQNQTAQLSVQYGGANYTTGVKIPLNAWENVELHVTTAGSGASTVQVWFNGSQVYQTTTASLGTAGVQTVQIGNNVAAQTFTQAVDNVTVSSANRAPTPTATSTMTAPSPTATSIASNTATPTA